MVPLAQSGRIVRGNSTNGGAAAAGTSKLSYNVIDLAEHGMRNIAVIVVLGQISSGGTVRVNLESRAGTSGPFTVQARANATDADEHAHMFVDSDQSLNTDRYWRVSLVRGTANSAVRSVTYVLYNSLEYPAEPDANTVV